MKQALDALDEKTTYGINGVVAVLVFARFAIAAVMMMVFFKSKTVSQRLKGLHGLILGVLMYAAYLSQMIGLDDIDPSVSVFLTSLILCSLRLFHQHIILDCPLKLCFIGVSLTFGAGFIHASFNLGTAEFIYFAPYCLLCYPFTQHTLKEGTCFSINNITYCSTCAAATVFIVGEGGDSGQWNLIFLTKAFAGNSTGVGGSFHHIFLNLFTRYLSNSPQSSMP